MLPASGLETVAGVRVRGALRESFTDSVVQELPVAMVYNGTSHVVMLATPVDLADFALGFALTEGIVENAGEFRLVDCTQTPEGVSMQAAIPQKRFDALATRRRNIAGRSGCGLCGIESLQEAIRPIRRLSSSATISAHAISEGVGLLSQAQPINRISGGVHAAGFVHAGGIEVREDIGRHNALDKLVGALAHAPSRDGFLVMSSRASQEIVHKAATAGFVVVVAISAPSDLAIRLAIEAGVTLVAFARGDGMTVYSHPERVT